MEKNLTWSRTEQGAPGARRLSGARYLSFIVLGNLFVVLFGLGTLRLVNAQEASQAYISITFHPGPMWICLTFSFRDFAQYCPAKQPDSIVADFASKIGPQANSAACLLLFCL